jgi:hypothetical protein
MMCKYCGNTGPCYSFLTMAVVYLYRKGKWLIMTFLNMLRGNKLHENHDKGLR